MGQIGSNLRLLEAKKRPSSISIPQVGTHIIAEIAGMIHSRLKKHLVPATLPPVAAYVALPHKVAIAFPWSPTHRHESR